MEIGKKRIFSTAFEGRDDIVKWDVRPVADGQVVKIVFLSKRSKYRQGVWLYADGGIEIYDKVFPSVYLWEDTSPKETVCRCHTTDGLLSVYNIWDKGRGFANSQSHTSGMIIEESGKVLVYHCNDIGFQTNFDKLVFSMEIVDATP